MRSGDVRSFLFLAAVFVLLAAFVFGVVLWLRPRDTQGPLQQFGQQTDDLLQQQKEERARQPGPNPPPTPESMRLQ